MGTDIHMLAERQNKQSPNRNWVHCPADKLQDWGMFFTRKSGACYSERNYYFFSLLVPGIRGFQKQEWPTIPIVQGVPDNASPQWKKYVEHWSPDFYGMGYTTLANLEAFDWEYPNQDVKGYYLKNIGDPEENESYLANLQADNLWNLESAEDLYNRVKGGTEAKGEVMAPFSDYFEEIVIHDSNQRRCRAFYEETLPFLRTLGEPDKVRVVFGFDN